MKHATSVVLDALEPLLKKLRQIDALSEKKHGVFYRRRSAFLHFHEDAAGFFADLRLETGWRRLPVTTAAERNELLRLVAAEFAPADQPPAAGAPPRVASATRIAAPKQRKATHRRRRPPAVRCAVALR